MKFLKYNVLFAVITTIHLFGHGYPDCKMTDLDISLDWTNKVTCAFHKMAHSYKDLDKSIERRMDGNISNYAPSEEQDDNASQTIKSESSNSVKDFDDVIELRGSAAAGGWIGIKPFFASRILGMATELKELTGNKLIIQSAYRDPQYQAKLFKAAVDKYGSVSEARKHVAPPGRSKHNVGLAIDVDMDGGQGDQLDSLGLLKKYSCWRPMSYEKWHIEPTETIAMRNKGYQPAVSDANLTGWNSNDVGMYNFSQKQMTREYGAMIVQSQQTHELNMLILELMTAENQLSFGEKEEEETRKKLLEN